MIPPKASKPSNLSNSSNPSNSSRLADPASLAEWIREGRDGIQRKFRREIPPGRIEREALALAESMAEDDSAADPQDQERTQDRVRASDEEIARATLILACGPVIALQQQELIESLSWKQEADEQSGDLNLDHIEQEIAILREDGTKMRQAGEPALAAEMESAAQGMEDAQKTIGEAMDNWAQHQEMLQGRQSEHSTSMIIQYCEGHDTTLLRRAEEGLKSGARQIDLCRERASQAVKNFQAKTQVLTPTMVLE